MWDFNLMDVFQICVDHSLWHLRRLLFLLNTSNQSNTCTYIYYYILYNYTNTIDEPTLDLQYMNAYLCLATTELCEMRLKLYVILKK